jgi:hypothetical protein
LGLGSAESGLEVLGNFATHGQGNGIP